MTDEDAMRDSKRCEMGLHAYRHVELKRAPYHQIPGEPFMWDHHRRCKRCGYERVFTVLRRPRIRTYQWQRPTHPPQTRMTT